MTLLRCLPPSFVTTECVLLQNEAALNLAPTLAWLVHLRSADYRYHVIKELQLFLLCGVVSHCVLVCSVNVRWCCTVKISSLNSSSYPYNRKL